MRKFVSLFVCLFCFMSCEHFNDSQWEITNNSSYPTEIKFKNWTGEQTVTLQQGKTTVVYISDSTKEITCNEKRTEVNKNSFYDYKLTIENKTPTKVKIKNDYSQDVSVSCMTGSVFEKTAPYNIIANPFAVPANTEQEYCLFDNNIDIKATSGNYELRHSTNKSNGEFYIRIYN